MAAKTNFGHWQAALLCAAVAVARPVHAQEPGIGEPPPLLPAAQASPGLDEFRAPTGFKARLAVEGVIDQRSILVRL